MGLRTQPNQEAPRIVVMAYMSERDAHPLPAPVTTIALAGLGSP